TWGRSRLTTSVVSDRRGPAAFARNTSATPPTASLRMSWYLPKCCDGVRGRVIRRFLTHDEPPLLCAPEQDAEVVAGPHRAGRPERLGHDPRAQEILDGRLRPCPC